MDEQLKKAILDRIEKNYSKEQIINELTVAGYDKTEAREYYDTVRQQTIAASNKAEQPEAVPASDSEDATNTESETAQVIEGTDTDVGTTENKGPILLYGSLAVLVVAIIIIFATGMHRSVVSLFTAASAPPHDEVTLLPAIAAQILETPKSRKNIEFLLTLEERESGTPTGYEEGYMGLMFLEMFGLFSATGENTARVQMNIMTDRSDPDNVILNTETDLQANLGSMAVQANFDVRHQNQDFYVRFGSVSEMLIQLLEIDIPKRTWIRYGEAESDHALDTSTALGDVFTGRYNAILQSIWNAWQQHPPISFATEPYAKQREGRTVFVYEVVPNMSTMESFLTELQEIVADNPEAAAVIGEEEAVSFVQTEVAVLTDWVQELGAWSDLKVYVLPDGSLQTVLFSGAVASPIDEYPYQFRVQVSLDFTADPELSVINPPADIHEQTWLELVQAAEMSAYDFGLTFEELPLENLRAGDDGEVDTVMEQLIQFFLQEIETYGFENQSYSGFCEVYNDTIVTLEQEYGTSLTCSVQDDFYTFVFQLPDERLVCFDWYEDIAILDDGTDPEQVAFCP